MKKTEMNLSINFYLNLVFGGFIKQPNGQLIFVDVYLITLLTNIVNPNK